MRNVLMVLMLATSLHAVEFTPVALDSGEGWQMKRGERRDPFTFAIAPVQPPIIQKKTTLDVADETLVQVQRLREQAEEALLEEDAAGALRLCDRALDLMKGNELPGQVSDLPRLRRAAETQKLRRDAEAAFEQLKLEVHGIVAQPALSSAIVNHSVISRGGLIKTAEGEVLLVEEIRGDYVVIRFRGYKMAAAIKPR